MAIRITCIEKDNGNHQNKHEGITRLGWRNDDNGNVGNSSRAAMVEFIEKYGDKSVYVRDRNDDVAYVDVVTPKERDRTKYLRTYADGIFNDNLLALKEC